MGSINFGKAEVVLMILNNVSRNKVILDVGACDGKWHKLLGAYYQMDAVEIFTPSIMDYGLESKYRYVFNCDIKDYKYGRKNDVVNQKYGCVVFGDVIEHMEVKDAQKTLEFAKKHADLVVVGVPYLWPQGKCYGNAWEEHIQDDLTHELFMERYPGFKLLMKQENYGWYYYPEEVE